MASLPKLLKGSNQYGQKVDSYSVAIHSQTHRAQLAGVLSL